MYIPSDFTEHDSETTGSERAQEERSEYTYVSHSFLRKSLQGDEENPGCGWIAVAWGSFRSIRICLEMCLIMFFLRFGLFRGILLHFQVNYGMMREV